MKQITEDYCSYEVSKILKEKGFSENTICKYADIGGIIEKWYDDYRERVLSFDLEEGYLIEPLKEPKDQYEIIGDTISAPTHQMALKWLREVYNIFIEIRYMPSQFTDEPTYKAMIWNMNTEIGTPLSPNISYTYFETCIEAAIKYTLENLI